MLITPCPIYVDYEKRLASKDKSILSARGCTNIVETAVTHALTQTHYDKYQNLSERLGIRITNLDFFVDAADIESAVFQIFTAHEKDASLNQIPLSKFDSLSQAYLTYNPKGRGVVAMSELVCVYKHLLVFQILGARPIFRSL